MGSTMGNARRILHLRCQHPGCSLLVSWESFLEHCPPCHPSMVMASCLGLLFLLRQAPVCSTFRITPYNTAWTAGSQLLDQPRLMQLSSPKMCGSFIGVIECNHRECSGTLRKTWWPRWCLQPMLRPYMAPDVVPHVFPGVLSSSENIAFWLFILFCKVKYALCYNHK